MHGLEGSESAFNYDNFPRYRPPNGYEIRSSISILTEGRRDALYACVRASKQGRVRQKARQKNKKITSAKRYYSQLKEKEKVNPQNFVSVTDLIRVWAVFRCFLFPVVERSSTTQWSEATLLTIESEAKCSHLVKIRKFSEIIIIIRTQG